MPLFAVWMCCFSDPVSFAFIESLKNHQQSGTGGEWRERWSGIWLSGLSQIKDVQFFSDESNLPTTVYQVSIYTLWLFNIAMKNGPFIDGLPIKNGDFHGYVSHNQMVIIIYALCHFDFDRTMHVSRVFTCDVRTDADHPPVEKSHPPRQMSMFHCTQPSSKIQ